MGCDFSIYGKQPDPVIRERCLNFVREWMGVVWKDLPEDDNRDFETTYRIDAGIPVVLRGKGYPRRDRPQPADRLLDEERSEPYERGRLTGLVIPWRPDPFVFDSKAGYRLCSLSIETSKSARAGRISRDFWELFSNPLSSDERLVLFEGFSTRIPTGMALYYVFAEVLRRHFIVDCEVSADYDTDIYSRIFTDIGLRRRIAAVGAKSLVISAVECSKEAQEIYNESVAESERRREERRKAAEAEIIRKAEPWKKEIYLATKFSRQFMEEIPLFGLTDIVSNPIHKRGIKDEFDKHDIGSERIRDTALTPLLVEALESHGVKRMSDALLLDEDEVLAIKGFTKDNLRQLQRVALASLGRTSSDRPQVLKVFGAS